MKKYPFVIVAVLAALLATSCGSSSQASFPNAPVKIIVARGAGGSTDIIGRLLAQYMQKNLGVAVNVENVAGGGGVTGTDQVFRSKPDGYTLLLAVTNTDIMTQVFQGTPYDFRKFVPVYNIGGGDSQVLAVRSDSKFKDFKSFVDAAKTSRVTVARLSGTNVSSIGMALMVDQAKIPAANLGTVSFQDGNAQSVAVLGGHVDTTLGNPSSIDSQLKSGDLRALIAFGKTRFPQLPNVPTFMELYPGENNYYELYQSLMAPPDTPADVVKTLDAAIKKSMDDPEFKQKAQPIFTPVQMDPTQLKTEIDKFYTRSEDLKPMLKVLDAQK